MSNTATDGALGLRTLARSLSRVLSDAELDLVSGGTEAGADAGTDVRTCKTVGGVLRCTIDQSDA